MYDSASYSLPFRHVKDSLVTTVHIKKMYRISLVRKKIINHHPRGEISAY